MLCAILIFWWSWYEDYMHLKMPWCCFCIEQVHETLVYYWVVHYSSLIDTLMQVFSLWCAGLIWFGFDLLQVQRWLGKTCWKCLIKARLENVRRREDFGGKDGMKKMGFGDRRWLWSKLTKESTIDQSQQLSNIFYLIFFSCNKNCNGL